MTVSRFGSSWGSCAYVLPFPISRACSLMTCAWERQSRALDVVAAKVVGIRRHDDVLVGRLAMHHLVRGDTRDDQASTANDCDDGDDPSQLRYDSSSRRAGPAHGARQLAAPTNRRACRMTARNQASDASPATADELDDGAPPGHS